MRSTAVLVLALAACQDIDVETFTYDPRGKGLELDVHAPAGAANAPAVLLVHGGSWVRGERGALSAVADQLARIGYVAATIDYRLVPDGTFPSAVRDVACALSYLRANAGALGVDADRVAILGYSAGGHLASLTAVASDVPELQDDGCPAGRTSAPAAVVSYAGPMDLTALAGEVVRDFVGIGLDDDPGRWALASPLRQVGAGEPPFLLVHAEHDLYVPVEQAEDMRAALRAADNSVSLLRLEGGGHAIGDGPGLGLEQWEPPYDTPEGWLALVDFLARTVGAP